MGGDLLLKSWKYTHYPSFSEEFSLTERAEDLKFCFSSLIRGCGGTSVGQLKFPDPRTHRDGMEIQVAARKWFNGV
jgi:hypothetical protein